MEEVKENLKGGEGEVREVIEGRSKVGKVVEKGKSGYKEEGGRWEEGRVKVEKFEMEMGKSGGGEGEGRI
ncbi:hypothetical protein [Kocuria rosea]|uniref:hypothetical protein n=1 Tax=Kocuria rosea TaxID=1275 RepID=UPI0011A16E34|nr:hypothetical protein [Kocuria rosea]